MPKFTKDQHERLKELARDCTLHGLSTADSIQYIHNNSKLDITDRTLRRLKAELRQDVKLAIALLKKGEFQYEAYRRTEEIRLNYRTLLELRDQAREIDDVTDRVKVLHAIEVDLSMLTMKLASLMDSMPFVSAVQAKLAAEESKKFR